MNKTESHVYHRYNIWYNKIYFVHTYIYNLINCKNINFNLDINAK